MIMSIFQALDSLIKSEEVVKQAKSALGSAGSTDLRQEIAQHWWTPGLEYDILLADLMIFQAILHFVAETISEYVCISRAIVSLNLYNLHLNFNPSPLYIYSR